MSDSTLGEILGAVLGGHGAAGPGPTGGLGGALGGVLGGGSGGSLGEVLGRVASGGSSPASAPGAGGNMLLATLLPLAMGWIQRNGGVGNVLDRFRQHGLGQQAATWVSTGANAPLQPEDVHRVVGPDEIRSMSQQLGVSPEEVSQGLSRILPQVIDRVSPEGSVQADADQRLDSGMTQLQSVLRQTLSRFG